MTEFSELGLSPTTLQAVAATGYTTATPIQAQAIPIALAGQDVLGIAQTGTGKTAAFTLPMIDRLAAGRAKARMPRALVIAPTRELADQVASSFEKYAKGTEQTVQEVRKRVARALARMCADLVAQLGVAVIARSRPARLAR